MVSPDLAAVLPGPANAEVRRHVGLAANYSCDPGHRDPSAERACRSGQPATDSEEDGA